MKKGDLCLWHKNAVVRVKVVKRSYVVCEMVTTWSQAVFTFPRGSEVNCENEFLTPVSDEEAAYAVLTGEMP